MSGRALALIPAFNEARNIGAVLARIREVDASLAVLVVDDGSTDGTAEAARRLGASVVSLPFNLGCGVALQTGYKYALREGYDVVVQLDADGQHEPADIPALVEVIRGGAADVAIGSRFIGAGSYRMGFARSAGMRFFCALAYAFTGIRFTDVTSGFRAWSRDVLRFFATDRYPVDYPDADLLIMLYRARFRIVEVPVRMYARTAGQSKQHAGLRPIYYIFKMLLSVGLTPLRREDRGRAEPT